MRSADMEAGNSSESGREIDMEISDEEDAGVLVGREARVLENMAAQVTTKTESSGKRKRYAHLDNSPSVGVTYQYLTRESKKRLQDALRQWAEGNVQHHIIAPNTEALESGNEMYFPALQIGPTTAPTAASSTMLYWVDRPAKQARIQEADGAQVLTGTSTSGQERGKEVGVPLYDRVVPTSLSSQDPGDNGYIMIAPGEPARCFNCGSYSHGLKDCPRPRDSDAINAARRNLAVKKGSLSVTHSASRYYQSTRGGKFDNIKPGVLGSETRQSLGIGEHDPPPWLHRMRELGYPPGYIDSEDEPSGIEIIGCDGDEDKVAEEVDVVFNNEPVQKELKTKTVEFPGVNAPIPENGNKSLWKAPTHARGGGNHLLSSSVHPVLMNGTVVPQLDSLSTTRSYRDWGANMPHFEKSSAYRCEYSPSGTPKSILIASPGTSRGFIDKGGNLPANPMSARGLSTSKEVGLSRSIVNEKLAFPSSHHTLSVSSRRSPMGSVHSDVFQSPLSAESLMSSKLPGWESPSPTNRLFRAPQSYLSMRSPVRHQHPYPLRQCVSPTPPKEAWTKTHADFASLHSRGSSGSHSHQAR